MKRQQTLINGQQQQQISIRDRALHYGDGLFETLAVKAGRMLAWDRHMARLQYGCHRLGIACPDSKLLHNEAAQLCENQQQAVLKLIVSRGEGGRGYEPPQIAQTTRIFSLYEWPDYPPAFAQKGIEATVCATRLGTNPTLAGIKHLNRLEQVMLRKELSSSNCPEAIVMDTDDKVIEGSMSNVFLVKNGKLSTPDLSRAGVTGIIRAAILEFVSGIKLDSEICNIGLDDVLQADEVFFCNSIAGIWPVSRIRDTDYKSGVLTKKLQQYLVDQNLIVL